MKILVTGANGYIGRHVTKRLLDEGCEVVACDLVCDNIDSRAQVLKNDVFSEREGVFEYLGRPDACIHLTWRDGFKHNSTAHMEDLPKHYRFLSRLVDEGLKQLLVMGTMHEVGYHEGVVDENTPCRPMSLYSIAKNALRDALDLACKEKCTYQWLRGFYVLGDDSANHSVFTKLLEAAHNGVKTFNLNSGKNRYDFINIDDLAEQIAAVAQQTAIDGIINVCSGKSISLGEKIEEYIIENNLDIKTVYGVFPDRPYDSPEIYGDTRKINEIMSHKAKS